MQLRRFSLALDLEEGVCDNNPQGHQPRGPWTVPQHLLYKSVFESLLESFMLDWAWAQIGDNMRPNQFGGLKKCGTNHFLSHLWTDLLENLEDNRSCVSLISLDFSKAFNRLDHDHVLRSYARLGASSQVIALFASFLSGRTMRVKVSDVLSSPRPVNGGAPQGSCAGVQIYAVGTDNIDADLPPPPVINVDEESAPEEPSWSFVEHQPRPLDETNTSGPSSSDLVASDSVSNARSVFRSGGVFIWTVDV